MTSELFRKWLVDFERDIAKNDRFIALIVDNCTAHPKYSADDLPHIRLVFLPPNVTSVIQPCYGDHQELEGKLQKKGCL